MKGGKLKQYAILRVCMHVVHLLVFLFYMYKLVSEVEDLSLLSEVGTSLAIGFPSLEGTIPASRETSII